MRSIEISEDYIKAGAPDTSVAELARLAQSSMVAVRRRVGENERTPSDVLRSLSWDPKEEVRIAVGLSRFASDAIVTRLANDEHDDVRYWLASTSYLPKNLLQRLVADSNPYVAARAKRTLDRLGIPWEETDAINSRSNFAA